MRIFLANYVWYSLVVRRTSTTWPVFKEIPYSKKTDVRVSRGIRYRLVPWQEFENANLLRSFRCNLFTAGSYGG